MAKTSGARTVAQARKWVGYLEKASNKNLDDFTANAGKANYTRFGRDYGMNPAEWCGMFVSMVFVYEYGRETAEKLLCGGLHSYTPSGAQYFKNRGRYIARGKGTPKAGDVIFFYSSAKGRIGHVGIVSGVKDGKVYTIEGNTSGANTLVTNGGGVREKSYALTSTYIDGYGSVNYDSTEQSGGNSGGGAGKVNVELDKLKKGSKGEQVKTVQRILRMMGYKGSNGKDLSIDGDFGSNTKYAVEEFQRKNGLGDDGIVGVKTWPALLK